MRITVSDLMNTEVDRLQENQTLLAAARLFLLNDISQIYVNSNKGEFVGLLTDYALIKARLAGLDWDHPLERLISRSVLTISADQEIPAVMPVFREGRGDLIPVLQEGLLVGELSRTVVLQMMLALDPSCALMSLEEFDDESILEKQCESDMNQESLRDERPVASPRIKSQGVTTEKVIPAPHLVNRPQGMITTLNAPPDLFRDQP